MKYKKVIFKDKGRLMCYEFIPNFVFEDEPELLYDAVIMYPVFKGTHEKVFYGFDDVNSLNFQVEIFTEPVDKLGYNGFYIKQKDDKTIAANPEIQCKLKLDSWLKDSNIEIIKELTTSYSYLKM